MNHITNSGKIKKSIHLNHRDIRSKVSFVDINSKHVKAKKTRGAITKLSRQARTRLFHNIRNMTEVKNLITLTYPNAGYAKTATGGNFMTDGKAVKYQFYKVKEWLKYHGYSGYWILEFQSRGAPHFHLYTREAVTDEHETTLKKLWHKIVGTTSKSHAQRGVQVEKFQQNGQELAAAYAAKYSTKGEQKRCPGRYKNPGQFWGWFGNMPKTIRNIVIAEHEIEAIVEKAKAKRNHDAEIGGYKLRKSVNGVVGHSYWNTAEMVREHLKTEYGITVDEKVKVHLVAKK